MTDEEAKLATTIFHDELAERRYIPVGATLFQRCKIKMHHAEKKAQHDAVHCALHDSISVWSHTGNRQHVVSQQHMHKLIAWARVVAQDPHLAAKCGDQLCDACAYRFYKSFHYAGKRSIAAWLSETQSALGSSDVQGLLRLQLLTQQSIVSHIQNEEYLLVSDVVNMMQEHQVAQGATEVVVEATEVSSRTVRRWVGELDSELEGGTIVPKCAGGSSAQIVITPPGEPLEHLI